MKIRLIKSKSILNRSSISGAYTLNPYFGCLHGCVYCYNQQFITRIRKDKEKWGTFLDIKINAPEILEKELIKKSKNEVFFSTVTDPYNLFEQKYQITRRCLEILLKYQWPVTILTKSDLVLKDIDLYKKFRQIKVGFSFTTLDDKISQLIEPKASLPSKRLSALEKLSKKNIQTYVFIAPILPKFTNLDLFFRNLGNKTKEIWFDSFNAQAKNWQGLREALKRDKPEYIIIYEEILSKNKKEYNQNLKKEIERLSQKCYLPIKIYF